jgi:hypothetical protein
MEKEIITWGLFRNASSHSANSPGIQLSLHNGPDENNEKYSITAQKIQGLPYLSSAPAGYTLLINGVSFFTLIWKEDFLTL